MTLSKAHTSVKAIDVAKQMLCDTRPLMQSILWVCLGPTLPYPHPNECEPDFHKNLIVLPWPSATFQLNFVKIK